MIITQGLFNQFLIIIIRARLKNTTGKSIESIIVKSRRAWLASALSCYPSIGMFATAEEAFDAYKAEAKKQFGEFARF